MMTKSYVIPVHEFWKAALLGEYAHYHAQSSLALNLFDIRNANQNEHFLIPMILGYLDFDSDHRSNEGFVSTKDIISEMQERSFTPSATEVALRRANNKKLLESPQRITFAEDETGLVGDMPMRFRISTIGAYHLSRWIGEFSFLDAMTYDTPILDEQTVAALRPKIASFKIADRLHRATTFRKYLTKVWYSSNQSPQYFDWSSAVDMGQESFDRVQRAIERTVASLVT